MLAVNLLGEPRLQIADDERHIGVHIPERGLALIGYLVYTRQPCARREAAQLLWSGRPHNAAQTNLRQLLKRIKQSFPYGFVWDDQEVDWAPALPWTCDLRQFELTLHLTRQELGPARHRPAASSHTDAVDSSEETVPIRLNADTYSGLQAAIDLFRSDFLNGLELDDSPAFAEWLYARREELRQKLLWATTLTARHSLANHDFLPGIAALRRAISIAPWHEPSHRQLIRLLALSGQRKDALEQYATCQRILARELNVGPAVETEMLYADIMAVERPAAGCPVQSPAPALSSSPPAQITNLPNPTHSIIGRQALFDKMTAALRVDGARLITLHGIGGVGKSALANEVGTALLTEFRDGVWRIVPGSGVLWDKIAQLGRKQFGMDLACADDVLEQFGRLHVLLILDDCDGIHAQTHWLETLLDAAPHLAILATAQRRLRLPSERSFWLDGLPVPLPERADLAVYVAGHGQDSVQLFIQAIRRIQPAYQLRRSDLPEIIAICSEVGGLPLAILQAANWIGQLSLQQIRQAIEQDVGSILPLFTGECVFKTTIGSIFSCSWHALRSAEQLALLRLSVFESVFSLDAADDVAAVSLSLLLQLVDHSFIGHEDGELYRWHPLVRHFIQAVKAAGEAHALDASDMHALQRRHATFFMQFLASKAAEYHGQAPRRAIDATRQLWPEIQRAWEVVLADRQVALCQLGLLGLAEYCAVTGQVALGNTFMQQAIELLEAAQAAPIDLGAADAQREFETCDNRDETLAWAYLYAARFSIAEGAVARAQAAQTRASQLAQNLEQPHLLAETLLAEAELLCHNDNCPEPGQRLLSLALQQAELAGSLRTQALIHRQIGAFGLSGNRYAEIEQSSRLAQECGDVALAVEQLSALGTHLVHSGQWKQGRSCLARAARLGFADGVSQDTRTALMVKLAEADLAIGNYDEALPRLQQVAAAGDLGHQVRDAVHARFRLAEIALRQGLPFDALEQTDAAMALVAAYKLTDLQPTAQAHSARMLVACGMFEQARQIYEQILHGQHLVDAPHHELVIWADWIEFMLEHGDSAMARSLGVLLLAQLEQWDADIFVPGTVHAWCVALETARQRRDERFVSLVEALIRALDSAAMQLTERERTSFWHAIPDHLQVLTWHTQFGSAGGIMASSNGHDTKHVQFEYNVASRDSARGRTP